MRQIQIWHVWVKFFFYQRGKQPQIYTPGNSDSHPGELRSTPRGTQIHTPGNWDLHPGELRFTPGGTDLHPGDLRFRPGGTDSHPGELRFIPRGTQFPTWGNNFTPWGIQFQPPGRHQRVFVLSSFAFCKPIFRYSSESHPGERFKTHTSVQNWELLNSFADSSK